MALRVYFYALVAGAGTFSGCSTSPFDTTTDHTAIRSRLTMPENADIRRSVYRQSETDEKTIEITLRDDAESYIRYALFHSPDVERAYQQWRAASERLPQVSALPDPRLKVGFFVNEVETRVGPQQAKVGIMQTFPWIGKLKDREDAAAKGALAAWYRYQDTQLRVSEQVAESLYELAFLDQSTQITRENLELLRSFEEVVRARYRVGAGSHPELIRVQVELGQLEDRVRQLEALRPSYVAKINASLNREASMPIEQTPTMPDLIADGDAQQASLMAHEWSPLLESINQQVEQERIKTEVARKDGYPDLTVGLDYIVTDSAANPSIAESGDDPVMLSFGINLPIWRDKYDAKVRESLAKRLSMSRMLDSKRNSIDSQIFSAWFEHSDADRRVRLYEQSLIPKAQESLSASLTGFRTGDSAFLDLLDTERTLLEFSISAQRARADRGKALAKLNRLVGHAIPTRNADQTETSTHTNEVQP